MASDTSRSRALTLGLALLMLLAAGYAWHGSRRAGEGARDGDTGGGSGAAPALRVHGEAPRLEDTPAARGEADTRAGEVWFEELTLDEEIAQSAPEIIVGRVLDEAGRPLGGVWVRLALDDDEPAPEDWQEQALQTEENGVFLFEELPKRVFRVVASRPVPRARDWRKGRPGSDAEIAWIERVVVEGVAAGRRDVRVRMRARPAAPEEWSARVRVFGPDGEPVPRWTYTECSNGGLWSSIDGWVEPEAGEAGEVFFSGAPPLGLIVHGIVDEAYEPLPVAPGYIHGIVPDAGEYVVHLKRAQAIRGRVALPAGVESANVVVRYALLTDGRAEDPTLVSDATLPGAFRDDMTGTEPDGSFELAGLPPGRVRLIPLLPTASLEHAPDDRGVTVDVGDHDARLRLPAHAPIRGTIDFGAVEGAREVGVQVYLRRVVDGRARVVWSRHLDASELRASGGAFESDPMPTDEAYDLEVWATGMLEDPPGTWCGWPLATRRVQQVQPGGAAVFVVLQKLPSIRGRLVQEDGTPAPAGIMVQALRADAHPIARAAYVGGDAALVDEGGDLVDLVSGEGLAGRPEPPVRAPPGPGPYEVPTVEGGHFDFLALPPGAYLLWTRGPHGAARLVDPPVQAGGGVVQLALARTHSIRGRVRADDAGSLDGFVVEARHADEPGRVLASSAVRSDGFFALDGLPDGAFAVTAYNARDDADARAAAYARVPSGSRRVALDLVPGGVLAGRVVDARGGAVHGARIEVTSSLDRRHAQVGADGRFRLGGLVGRDLGVRAVLPDGRAVEQIVVAAEEGLRLVVP